jgi:thioredoxin-related protein
MRKKIIVSFIFFLLGWAVNAQDWQTSFEEAKRLAAEKNSNIILVFQGSDWCAPCIKLDKEIWATDEFKAYAATHFIMLKADFPRKKQNALGQKQQEQNAKLAEMYNQSGYFPFVVVLSKDGKVLGETSYQKKSPQEYISLLTSFK